MTLRFDLRRRRADRVDALHPLAQQIVEHGVVAAFVFAAENQVDVRGERFQRFDRRIDVGGFGVVVVVDAADGGDKFQPVLDRLEVATAWRIFSGAQPISTPRTTAARTFSRLCAPFSGISETSMISRCRLRIAEKNRRRRGPTRLAALLSDG